MKTDKELIQERRKAAEWRIQYHGKKVCEYKLELRILKKMEKQINKETGRLK